MKNYYSLQRGKTQCRIIIVYKEVKHNAELFPTSWSSTFSPNKFEVLSRKSFKGGKGDSLMVR